MRRTLEEIFWTHVDTQGPDDCWNWTACKNYDGYGRWRYHGKQYYAHRVSIYLETGEWPPANKFVCHICNNPSCVNPAHLYVGTHQDNMEDVLLSKTINLINIYYCYRGKRYLLP